MKVIFKTLFGSHLYGLDTPQSDKDYKAIAVPDGKDILLQKAFKVLNETTKPKGRIKNTNDDTDLEIFSLHQFIKLCKEGQTVALDMLFAPEEFWLSSTGEWRFIQKHRNKLLHKKATAFVGYCQVQAAKYGIKGSRMGAVRKARDFMSKYVDCVAGDNGPLRLIHIWDDLEKSLGGIEHIKFIKTLTPAADTHMKEIETIEICNRKIQAGVKCKHAHQMLSAMFDKYGERARKAETNEGIDWKAVSHAFRVCYEAKELMTTGFITFPLKERKFILKVKTGALEYKGLSESLEEEIEQVKKLSERNDFLPAEADAKFWENFLLKTYRSACNQNDISAEQ